MNLKLEILKNIWTMGHELTLKKLLEEHDKEIPDIVIPYNKKVTLIALIEDFYPEEEDK